MLHIIIILHSRSSGEALLCYPRCHSHSRAFPWPPRLSAMSCRTKLSDGRGEHLTRDVFSSTALLAVLKLAQPSYCPCQGKRLVLTARTRHLGHHTTVVFSNPSKLSRQLLKLPTAIIPQRRAACQVTFPSCPAEQHTSGRYYRLYTVCPQQFSLHLALLRCCSIPPALDGRWHSYRTSCAILFDLLSFFFHPCDRYSSPHITLIVYLNPPLPLNT